MATKITRRQAITVPVSQVDRSVQRCVCSRYVTYDDGYQGQLITEADVYNFLVQNFMDVSGTDPV